MPRDNRWAVVFISVLGENAQEGLSCLKALAGPVKTVSGALFGYSAARRLEKLLRESVSAVQNSGGIVVEYVIRFITLLVEKNQFKYIDLILQRIEERIDGRNGTLTVIFESAAPMDGVLEEELKTRIARQTGAVNVKMKTRLVPDLLGGYRLRVGGFYVDASVKGQMEKMQAELEAVL
ncbi:MAG: F0F1 ATP synthase subunit delta [Treponema sp.]|nr:F0F1 ATP synthase subunit delta [Treponema sp.]